MYKEIYIVVEMYRVILKPVILYWSWSVGNKKKKRKERNIYSLVCEGDIKDQGEMIS